MKRTLGLFVALMTALPAWAADVTSFTLDNGMDVVVLEDHRAPVVVHMVWYRAGAADEPPGKSGIAHYLEHLLFKGTDDMAPGEFSDVVARNGGSDNAFTSQDYTAYFQRVAADRLEAMMRMEADRMRDLQLDEQDILVERDVIDEERNQRIENNPGALFQEELRAAQFLNHPYGIPTVGWKHEVNALVLDDALGFYRKFYAPNNAILIVAGDTTPEEVRTLAEKYYGPLEPTVGLGERMRPQEPPQRSPRWMTYEDPRVSQPYVTRSYLTEPRRSGDQADAAARVLLAEILGGDGQTSYLPQKLQFETQQAIYSGAFYDSTALDDSIFGLSVVPAPGVSLAEAEAAMDDVIAQFIEEGVDPEQLDRIKTQLAASRIYAEDSVQGLARRYGVALTSGLTIEDVEAWPDVLDAVTGEDIIAAAEEIFASKATVTGWLMTPGMNADGSPQAAEEVSQ